MQRSMPLDRLQFSERLVIFVTLTLIGLAISLFLSFPTAGLMMIAVGAVTCVGTDSIIRAHPLMRGRSFRDTIVWWTLPATWSVSACLFLRLLSGNLSIAGWALTGVALAGIYTAQFRAIDPDDEYARTARQGLLLATYLTAFAALAAIYSLKTRSIQTGTFTFIAGTLITFELLRWTGQPRFRRWIYALSVGLGVGETIWALNYVALSGLAGGALLLLTYYVLSGLASTHLNRQLTRVRALEYGGVGLAGLIMILVGRFIVGG